MTVAPTSLAQILGMVYLISQIVIIVVKMTILFLFKLVSEYLCGYDT